MGIPGQVTDGGGSIAFVFAMPMEAQPLVRRLGLVPDGPARRGPWRGRRAGRPVTAVVTGMGTALADRGVRELLDRERVDHVVVVGITGALRDDTPIGTLIRPSAVVHSGTGGTHRPVHLGGGSPRGVMWTTDDLTTDPAELSALGARGVVSLDMETAAVGAVCEDREVPWSVIRSISDRAGDGTIDDAVFGLSHQDGSPDPRAVTRFVLARPHRIPTLVSIGRNAQHAARVAADAAVRICTAD